MYKINYTLIDKIYFSLKFIISQQTSREKQLFLKINLNPFRKIHSLLILCFSLQIFLFKFQILRLRKIKTE